MCARANGAQPPLALPAGALAAYGVLRAMSTVLESIHALPHLYAQVGAGLGGAVKGGRWGVTRGSSLLGSAVDRAAIARGRRCGRHGT